MNEAHNLCVVSSAVISNGVNKNKNKKKCMWRTCRPSSVISNGAAAKFKSVNGWYVFLDHSF